jgi:large subunit ribosomal protein L5
MNRLKKDYTDRIAPELKTELGLKSVMEVPRLKKIVVNAGIGDLRENREALEAFVSDLADITGQKPSHRKARSSESGFKIRQGDIVGYTVTLRGESMWAFLDKLVTVVLPRVRDFKGLSLNSFDKGGNYSLGIREHIIFPEVNPNKIKGIRSLQIIFNIDGKSKENSKLFMEKLGIPFTKDA